VDRHLPRRAHPWIWYWCTDQVIVQRVLSARDEGHAKAGTIFAGFLKILRVHAVLPGIVAYALFPEQMKAKPTPLIHACAELAAVGMVGLVMAALLAAVMGAMSSVFNSASTLSRSISTRRSAPTRRKTAGEFRSHRHWIYGAARTALVPFIHSSAASSTFICKACRPTSARRSHHASCLASCGRG